MKRFFVSLMALGLLSFVSIGLTGCGGGAEPGVEEEIDIEEGGDIGAMPGDMEAEPGMEGEGADAAAEPPVEVTEPAAPAEPAPKGEETP